MWTHYNFQRDGFLAHYHKRATLRGLRELRLEQAILAYQRGHRSSEAAQIAGLPRTIFLQALIDRDVTILEEPPTLAEQLERLAERFGNERLAEVARQVTEERRYGRSACRHLAKGSSREN